jgi:hypothetical protein
MTIRTARVEFRESGYFRQSIGRYSMFSVPQPPHWWRDPSPVHSHSIIHNGLWSLMFTPPPDTPFSHIVTNVELMDFFFTHTPPDTPWIYRYFTVSCVTRIFYVENVTGQLCQCRNGDSSCLTVYVSPPGVLTILEIWKKLRVRYYTVGTVKTPCFVFKWISHSWNSEQCIWNFPN